MTNQTKLFKSLFHRKDTAIRTNKTQELKQTCIRTARKCSPVYWMASAQRLQQCAEPLVGSQVRTEFLRTELGNLPRVSSNHSHPQAAALRNLMGKHFQTICDKAGYTRYDVSMSRREQREGTLGTRQIFSPRDVNLKHQWDTLQDKHCVTMIDVDYYLTAKDWNRVLVGHPVLIYTFAPLTVSGRVNDGTFVFTSKDTVEMYVSGGAKYTHQLWDYTSDHIVSHHKGITYVYTCDFYRPTVDDTRMIICLAPKGKVIDPLYKVFRSEKHMQRIKHLTHNGFIISRYIKNNMVMRSMGRLGMYSSVELSEAVLFAIETRLRLSTWKSPSDVERFLREECKDDRLSNATKATLVFEVLSAFTGVDYVGKFVQADTVYIEPECYQATDGLITEDAKPTIDRILPIIIENAGFAPGSSYNNDLACLEGRLHKVKNPVDNPGREFEKYAGEFVDLLVGSHCSTGCPIDASEVMEVQTLPTQKLRSRKAQYWLSASKRTIVSAFQKRESYPKIAEPRNISSTTTNHQVLLSTYTKSFKMSVLSQAHWYIPGMTPNETADMLMNLVSQYESIVETDFSRFDGTQNEWLRTNVEFAAYLKWINKHDYTVLKEHLYSEVNATAFTSHGIMYNTAGTRLSGSPTTTDGNSMINAFVNYCAYRRLGYQEHLAYALLGSYYGDDGLSGVVREDFPAQLEETCKLLGLKLKSVVKRRGEPIGYLGRVFLDLPRTRLSIQDPLRTMGKIHLGFRSGNSKQVAINKLRGYLVTDFHAPIIGTYCRKALELLGGGEYQAGDDREMDYKIERGSWPDSRVSEAAYSYVADVLGYDIADIYEFESKIMESTTLAQFPFLSVVELKSSTITVARNGEILSPPIIPKEQIDEHTKSQNTSPTSSEHDTPTPTCTTTREHTGPATPINNNQTHGGSRCGRSLSMVRQAVCEFFAEGATGVQDHQSLRGNGGTIRARSNVSVGPRKNRIVEGQPIPKTVTRLDNTIYSKDGRPQVNKKRHTKNNNKKNKNYKNDKQKKTSVKP